jgi:RNA polymerase sigma factor for flagellar operon FliA
MPGHAEGAGSEVSLLDVVPSEGYAEPQPALDSDDAAAALQEVITELPERQQFVLSCYYREELRLSEIAEILCLSESRVSQLHTKALISLRAAITEECRERLQGPSSLPEVADDGAQTSAGI